MTKRTDFSRMQLICSLACMMMSRTLVSLSMAAKPLTKSASSPGREGEEGGGGGRGRREGEEGGGGGRGRREGEEGGGGGRGRREGEEGFQGGKHRCRWRTRKVRRRMMEESTHTCVHAGQK